MNCGRRYGLVGLNGSGKSTILACIGNREVGKTLVQAKRKVLFSGADSRTYRYILSLT